MLQVVSDLPGRIPVLLQQGRTMRLSFLTLWWLFLCSRDIWVIRTNSYTAHRVMLVIVFVSFPNRPVSLTPSVSSQASWNSWYQNFFPASKSKCGCFIWQLSHSIRIYILPCIFLQGSHITFHIKSQYEFFLVFKCQHSFCWEKCILMQYFIAYIRQVCQRFQISLTLTVLYLIKWKK